MLPFGSAQGKLAQHDKNFHPLKNNFLTHKKQTNDGNNKMVNRPNTF